MSNFAIRDILTIWQWEYKLYICGIIIGFITKRLKKEKNWLRMSTKHCFSVVGKVVTLKWTFKDAEGVLS